MNTILLTFLLLMLLVLKKENDKLKVRKQLRQGIISGRVVGLDVRTPVEFRANESLGAKNITVQRLCNEIYELEYEKTILVFCEAGGRASLAKAYLRKRGFERVINIRDWRTWNRLVKGGQRV